MYAYRQKEQSNSFYRVMKAAIILILLFGLAAQIIMITRINSQNRKACAVESEIVELNATADNLKHSISQYHDLDRISARATQLGMNQPTDDQIRVVSVNLNTASNG